MYKKEKSPLTQGLNYRSACDRKLPTVPSPTPYDVPSSHNTKHYRRQRDDTSCNKRSANK